MTFEQINKLAGTGQPMPEELKEQCRNRLPKELRVVLDQFDKYIVYNRE